MLEAVLTEMSSVPPPDSSSESDCATAASNAVSLGVSPGSEGARTTRVIGGPPGSGGGPLAEERLRADSEGALMMPVIGGPPGLGVGVGGGVGVRVRVRVPRG